MSYQKMNLSNGALWDAAKVAHIEDGIVANEARINSLGGGVGVTNTVTGYKVLQILPIQNSGTVLLGVQIEGSPININEIGPNTKLNIFLTTALTQSLVPTADSPVYYTNLNIVTFNGEYNAFIVDMPAGDASIKYIIDSLKSDSTLGTSYCWLSNVVKDGNQTILSVTPIAGNTTIPAAIAAYAEGYYTASYGTAAHAEGYATYAYGPAAHAEGWSTHAIGAISHAEGQSTQAKGVNSHAEGAGTQALGDCSHAEGLNTSAEGECSHASGVNSHAYGDYSYVEGQDCKAYGGASHAEGHQSYTGTPAAGQLDKGVTSHAEGLGTAAVGNYAHSEGSGTVAEGDGSHAEGISNKASGEASHAEGYKTEATGTQSHAEGAWCKATGMRAHAEGYYSQATNSAAHAEGSSSVASGQYSHAEGFNVNAAHEASHAEGWYTQTGCAYQHVQGKANTSDSSKAFIIGIGENPTKRANGFTVSWQGAVNYSASAQSETGADYAEYFEWKDGNESNEDRIGYLVALNADKIVKAQHDDEVLGVISGTAGVIGDVASFEWSKKYETDEYGRVIWDMVEEFVESIDENGDTISESVGFFPHRRLSSTYNPEETYVPRSERKEWDIVGLMGKLHIRDDGTCEVGCYVGVSDDNPGIATLSVEKTNIRMMKRINDNVILAFVK